MSSKIIIDPGVLSIDRIIKLNKTLNNQIILITAYQELLKKFKKKDKDVKIYLYPHISKKGKLPEIKNLKLNPVMVWQKIINDHQTFLLYDRSKFLPFSSSLKVSNIIEDVLRCIFWFEKMKPNYLIYMFMPHSLETWIFARVSEFFGTKVLYFQSTILPWRLFFFEGIKKKPYLVKIKFNKKDKIKSESKILSEFFTKKTGGTKNIMPKYETDRLEKNNNKYFSFFKEIFRSWPRIDLFINKFLCYYYYQKIAQTKNLSDRYVIYFLHYNPERTTLPESFGFAQQYGAISALSMALPKNVKLYIKEHPSIFTYQCHWKERTRFWYKMINKLPNVKFIKMEENPYDLIDCSVCAATISGTTAVEAVLRNKKAVIFGNGPFNYLNTNLIHRYSNINDLKKFFIIKKSLNFDISKYFNQIEDKTHCGISTFNTFQEIEKNLEEVTHNAIFSGIDMFLTSKK